MKKIISLILALCLMLSMALSAGAAEAEKPVYLVLGDEIAAGEDLKDGELSFSEIIADELGYKLVNLASHGQTAEKLLEQVTSGEIDSELKRAELITVTCVVHDTIDLVFAKALASYNAAYEPDITAGELTEIMQDTNDPRFMKLAMIALAVFNGDPSNNIPPYLESEEFEASLEAALELVDETIAAIRKVNSSAAIVITTQYNPYASFTGTYAVVSQKLDQGLQKLNMALLETKYDIADVYMAFKNSEENLCNASMEPRNLDFTPNAAGHKVMAECIMDAIPEKIVNPFTDVKEGKYYYDAVLWAVGKGITSGTSATTFSPKNECTREQVVTFLWRAFGSPEPQTTENPFTDVKEGKYYYKAVLWAVEHGITSGTSATTFSPQDVCTREQVVTFLWRAAAKPAPKTSENPFSDVKAGKYYTDAVLWAVEMGITSGTSSTTFSPKDNCIREQIVTFLYRAFVK